MRRDRTVIMEVVRRQSSQSSCAASERIMALGGQTKPEEALSLAPVDLDTAEEHVEKIENALLTIKERLAEIMKTCPLGAHCLIPYLSEDDSSLSIGNPMSS